MNVGKTEHRCPQIVEWNDEKLHAVFVQRVTEDGLISLSIYLELSEQSEDYAPGTLFEIIELPPGEKDGTVLVKNYSECKGAFSALCDAGILISAEEEDCSTEEASNVSMDEESRKKNETSDEEKFQCCAIIGVCLPKEFFGVSFPKEKIVVV